MQVLHQTQHNLNNKSTKINTWLHFWQFENNFFENTYSPILNNKESIDARYKNDNNKIECPQYS